MNIEPVESVQLTAFSICLQKTRATVGKYMSLLMEQSLTAWLPQVKVAQLQWIQLDM